MATAPTTRAKATPAAATPAADAPVNPATDAPAKIAAPAKAKVQPAAASAAAESPATILKSYENIIAIGKDTVEAWTEAGTILSRGVQDLNTKVLGLAQNLVEQNVSATKQLLTVKTIRDAVDLQTTFSRDQFDRLVSEGSHLSDLSIKLVEETLAPISQKVNAAIDKLVKTA